MSLKLRLRSETWAVAISPSPAHHNWLNAVEEIPSETTRHRLDSGGKGGSPEITHKPRLTMICRNGKCLTSKMNLIINTSHAMPWHSCHSFYSMLIVYVEWKLHPSLLLMRAPHSRPSLVRQARTSCFKEPTIFESKEAERRFFFFSCRLGLIESDVGVKAWILSGFRWFRDWHFEIFFARLIFENIGNDMKHVRTFKSNFDGSLEIYWLLIT